MGCFLSKPAVRRGDEDEIEAALAVHFEQACRLDPELLYLDATLRRTTSRAISALADDAPGLRSLSFKSLLEATDGLSDVGRAAILQLKDDIARNPDLLFFVNDYFKNSVDVLRFFTSLRGCLSRTREREAVLRDALEHFGGGDYAVALGKLRAFRIAGEPFTESFVAEFRSVSEQQRRTLDALRAKKHKLDGKLGSVRAWRKVWTVVYLSAVAAAFISSVVLAAVSVPPAATAAAAAVTAAAVPVEEWLESLWDGYECGFEKQSEAVAKLRGGAFLAIHELESIRLLVERVEVGIGWLVNAAGLAVEEETAEAVRVAMEEMKTKLRALTKSVEELGEKMEQCSSELRNMMVDIVKTLTNPNEL